MLAPFNFKQWLEEHRHLLKPPVGNQVVFEDSEFIVMVIGGPNARADYHVNQSEEVFYQVEGDIVLKVREKDQVNDITIKQGDIFLLPPRIPHSPQRPKNTVGLVIERKRRQGEDDGFIWYCSSCEAKVWQKFFFLTDIVSQLPEVFSEFYDNPDNCRCPKCGQQQVR